MQRAPFFDDLAEGPEGGVAYWVRTEDGVNIRLGHWPAAASKAGKGTIFLFPGRTEYAEKYGRTASTLVAEGYHVLTVDWRCQGLADRLLDNPYIGHVESFTDYQHDVAALFEAAETLELPSPWFLVAHSMGGCIGLRTVIEETRFEAAVFSSPMWGITFHPALRAVVGPLTHVAHSLSLGERVTPTTGETSYLLTAGFDGNILTTDPDMWDYMVRQTRAQKRFGLGGPSLTWLRAAVIEGQYLARARLPDLPVWTAIGTAEKIVDPGAVRSMMVRWNQTEFTQFDHAEHELMMERPEVRDTFWAKTFDVFDKAAKD